MQRSTYVSALAAVVAGVLFFLPTLGWLVRSWRVHPYYAHGFLLPPLAAWFLWQRRDRLAGGSGLPSGTNTGPWWCSARLAGHGLVLAGVGTGLLSARTEAYPMSAAGMVLVGLGLAMLLGGRPAFAAAAFPGGLLLLSIPLPLAERVAPALAADVAGLAARAAGALGTPVIQAGASLAVADGNFTIGAPCSGLRSLVALVTLAYVMAGVVGGSGPRRALLVAAAIPLALAVNWARVTGLLVFTHHYGARAGLAIFDGPASPALFLAATAVLMVFARSTEQRATAAP